MNWKQLTPACGCGRRAGALARSAALVLGACLSAPALADMYRPVPTPGGIDPHPQLTAVITTATNVTVTWHGLQSPYVLQTNCALGQVAWSNALSTAIAWPAYDGSVTLSNLAAAQCFFRMGLTNNSYRGAEDCWNCHSDKYQAWSGTAHAHALDGVLTLPPAAQQSCLPCHSLGYGLPGGFVDTNTTPLMANVQCENCHGPAGAHKLLSNKTYHPVNSVAAEVCGGCHGDSHSPTYWEWTNSPHAQVVPDVASGFVPDPNGQGRQMSCGPCHSGATRSAMLQNYADTQAGYLTLSDALVLPSGNDAATFAQTCVVCHDPHATNSSAPYQLRNPIASTNFFTFYTGSATNSFGQYVNTTFNTQYVASVQVCAQCHNTRGARWTDTSRPPHGSSQYNMLLGDVGEFPSGVAPYQPSTHALHFTNQCVDCHMQSSPYVSEDVPANTGHKFTVDNFAVCTQCHGPNASNLVNFAENNFLPAQAQQVVSALDYWAATAAPPTLTAKYGSRAWEYTTPGALSSGGSGPTTAEQVMIPDNIKKARYDLYLAYNEHASGIHNPQFVVSLMNAALSFVQTEISP